jgi:superkiller protein 3
VVSQAVTAYLESVQARLKQAEVDRAAAQARAAAEQARATAEQARADEEQRRRQAEQAKAHTERQRRRLTVALAAAGLLLVAGAGAAGWWYQQDQLEQAEQQKQRDVEEGKRQVAEAAQRAREATRKDYVTKEVTPALQKAVDGLKELQLALGRLLPDEKHPLSVSVLLSDLKQWRDRVQTTKALYQQARKLTDSYPEALAKEQKARLEQLGTEVEQAEAQYQIALQLDTIRVDSSMVVNGDWREGHVEPQYEKVFREQLGLDLKKGALPQLGQRAKASPLRYVLAATLDHWADVAPSETAARLLEVARRADPDPWRDQVRDLKTWENVPTMRHLADVVQPAHQTPQILVLMARRLYFAGVRLRGKALKQKSAALEQEAETWQQEATALLRRALVQYPADFWLNWELGFRSRDLGERIGSYRAALSVRPTSALTYNNLGWALHEKKDAAGAIACYVKALELDPKYSLPRNNLVGELGNRVEPGVVLQSFQQPLKLDRKLAWAHNTLGWALYEKKDLGAAIACFNKALECDPKFAPAYHNLGMAREAQKNVVEAIACYQKALEYDPNDTRTLNNLGIALGDKGDVAGAIACYVKALELDPKFSLPRNNLVWLGEALHHQGKMEEAIAAFRACSRLNPKWALAHDWIAFIRVNAGDGSGALPFAEKAVELDPHGAQARWNLGRAQLLVGDLDGAITSYKKAIALDAKHSGARSSLARAERLAAVRDKLAAFQNGSYVPAGNAERLDLAEWCRIKKLHHTATRLYVGAFAAEPKLADDLRFQHRYNAACYAALAAAGQAEDAAKLDDKERVRLRKQALGWLRADLALWTKQLGKGQPGAGAEVQRVLRHWQKDTDLAAIRDQAALAKLPAEERAACERLWADVAALLQKAETATKEGK